MEIKITAENYSEVKTSSKVVLVDFWATWCGPCRALAPTVEAIAAEYEGKVTVGKCDVDECEDIAAAEGIRSIPTLIYFKDGAEVTRTMGAVPASDIREKLNALLQA